MLLLLDPEPELPLLAGTLLELANDLGIRQSPCGGPNLRRGPGPRRLYIHTYIRTSANVFEYNIYMKIIQVCTFRSNTDSIFFGYVASCFLLQVATLADT